MLTAFVEVFRNLRNNFFQTFLSVLGVIIGVAALVAMLSLIDGLEQYTKDKMAERASLSFMAVIPNKKSKLNGVWVDRDSVAILDERVLNKLTDTLPYEFNAEVAYEGQTFGSTPEGKPYGLRYWANSYPAISPPPDSSLLHGNWLTEQHAAGAERVAFINDNLAAVVGGAPGRTDVIGQRLPFLNDTLRIVGVYESPAEDSISLAVHLPLATLRAIESPNSLHTRLHFDFAEATDVLDAQVIVDSVLARHFAGLDDPVRTVTQSAYLTEIKQGVQVFRLVMGMIVGIAVLVGGIGVMNVLLMSINERTSEIGVRKAVGASRKTIVRQFLSEALAISAIGCFFGVVLGYLLAAVAAPVINFMVEDLDFSAVLSLRTAGVIVIIAILIGVIFGTYPARKAASLDPVEAIRK